jgi:hypothetical protein
LRAEHFRHVRSFVPVVFSPRELYGDASRQQHNDGCIEGRDRPQFEILDEDVAD